MTGSIILEGKADRQIRKSQVCFLTSENLYRRHYAGKFNLQWTVKARPPFMLELEFFAAFLSACNARLPA
jgi:hypothetical protein